MVFDFKKPSGKRIYEKYENGSFFIFLSDGVSEEKIELYKLAEEREEERNAYLGFSADEVLDSGEDILAKKLLSDGDPVYSEVKRAMPKLIEGAYAFLGGVASWSGVTVNPDGSVIPQQTGRDRTPNPMFSPLDFDSELGKIMPKRVLLGGIYPVLASVHTDGEKTLEFLYFVDPCEPDRDPIVWIRAKRYENKFPEKCSVTYQVAALAREGDEALLKNNPPAEEIFLDALSDTVFFWNEYFKAGMEADIPDAEISKIAKGAMAFSAITFTADHPHYGHRFYGMELHDNFPPNYIWAIEAACAAGRGEWARQIFAHLLSFATNSEGRISYRQGTGLNFGASAVEYGMLLTLANKYKKILGLGNVSKSYEKKLLGMANEIYYHCVPCPEFEGRVLLKMCAEADTNERVNVYLNNNLWAVRGFSALASLIKKTNTKKYTDMAELLMKNVSELIEEYTARDTRFGDIVPFRFGYTATPLTLSVCRETFYPIPDAELDAYLNKARTRGPESDSQDISENTYANYRYYPEALCAMLLPKESEDAIIKMRESLGGELLGMTRFRSWVDNWPVVHYARFLIESGRIEKYLLLMYAHAAHHGRADLMAYYEQIKIDGAVRANDCVPSLLTVPIMLAWAFAYETVRENKLRLCSAVPKSYFEKGFSAKGVGYSGGTVDIEYKCGELNLSFSSPTPKDTELVFRAKDKISSDDIEIGREFIKEINGNVLVLNEGVTDIKIKLN